MTPRSALDMPALDFAVEALGCERSGAICVEHPSAGERFCPEATRLAALIEARDREIRADECEEIAKAVWAARAERYPLDVFPKPPPEAYHAAHEALQAQGFTLDAMSADMFRRSYAALAKDADERATQHRGDKP
jgi:hypothetical protein